MDQQPWASRLEVLERSCSADWTPSGRFQRGKVCLKIFDEMPWNTFTTSNNFKVFNQIWSLYIFQYFSIQFLETEFFLALLWSLVLHCAGAAPQTSACRGAHSSVRPTSPCATTAPICWCLVSNFTYVSSWCMLLLCHVSFCSITFIYIYIYT